MSHKSFSVCHTSVLGFTLTQNVKRIRVKKLKTKLISCQVTLKSDWWNNSSFLSQSDSNLIYNLLRLYLISACVVILKLTLVLMCTCICVWDWLCVCDVCVYTCGAKRELKTVIGLTVTLVSMSKHLHQPTRLTTCVCMRACVTAGIVMVSEADCAAPVPSDLLCLSDVSCVCPLLWFQP